MHRRILVLLAASFVGQSATARARDFYGEGATVYAAVLATVARGDRRPILIDRLMPLPRHPERARWVRPDSIRREIDSLVAHAPGTADADSAASPPAELRLLGRLVPADSALAAAKAALGGLAVYQLSRILYSADSTGAVVAVDIHCGDLWDLRSICI